MRKRFLLILIPAIVLIAVFTLRGGEEETAEEAVFPVEGVVQMEEVAAVKAVKAGVSISLGTVKENTEDGGVIITVDRSGDALELSFSDVAADAWYLPAVNYAASGALMDGILSEGKFGPDLGITRAQFAVVLYRFLGGESVEGESVFADVESDAWYYEEVNWAVQMGYLSGSGVDTFGADEFISCEQVLSVLHRLAGEVKSNTTLENYPYAPKVSAYAKNAVAWAWGAGLIAEEEAIWYPTQTVSRAQLALLLMRYDALTGGTISQ